MKQYVVAMVASEEFIVGPENASLSLRDRLDAFDDIIDQTKRFELVKLLDTGKLYTLEEAQAVVEKLQKTCQPELKHLDFDRFVVYNVNTPTE